jgi:uroporphyrinogen decarboxylase
MLPRDRVFAALDFLRPDKIPLEVCAAAGGLFEHGQKLLDLTKACGHDFGSLDGLSLPNPPPPTDYDADGRYHAIRTDEWGTTWEYRIFGIWGHPKAWPLNDWSRLATYKAPAFPLSEGPDAEQARRDAARHKEQWFYSHGAASLMERMTSLRRFEDVLMDIQQDSPEIDRLMDLLVDHAAGWVRRALAVDADAVAFGDDYGTQEALLFSPATWRRFFRPRYERLFEPIRRAGKRIFFHSCGQVSAIFPDFHDLGVAAIWPQLPLWDLKDLAKRCRDLGLAVQLHPDRGALMQRGSPGEVRDYVLRMLDDFRTADGGSWLYIEIDPGFPWPNVEALFRVAMEVRGE